MSISTLQTRFIPASCLRSRLLLDLIGNHRICSPTGKRVTNLGLIAVLDRDYSVGSYRVLYLKNTKKIKSFPSNLSHAVVRKRFIDLNEALKRFYRSSNAELQMRKRDEEDTQDLVEAPHPKEGQLTVGQKVKQAGKDASYMGILLIGFGITGVLIWYVLSELLFSFSPNSVYSKALGFVKQHEEVINAVGQPIKAYGEETSRGRRRHVSHQEYIVDGVNYMRVKFYVSGSKRKATVHVDTKETSRGKFEFRYIFVELDGYPAETIVVQDNR